MLTNIGAGVGVSGSCFDCELAIVNPLLGKFKVYFHPELNLQSDLLAGSRMLDDGRLKLNRFNQLIHRLQCPEMRNDRNYNTVGKEDSNV